ncbi:hypothetical protein L8Q72_12740 [Enterobacter cloacae]|uniref:RNase A-like domain-containing protein n=2 Tax=Enterobacter cloacae TaxID=550 RepID=UPI00112042E9|nr:RNase A-like domain-containing protein [Enterobacter cloacae]MCI1182999.1 hypothetical protein [Enterobacter cloacae]MCK6747153.1 hypothetical protein [Enterobacter cloacae]MCK6986582.1 hypothetical protein [Enterobacter cloacae]MCQ4385308.1 hypothetical protein [Enterobacter cloacae]MCR4215683.1 hypothetical protein [Enterobacter cloacae]
MEESGMTVVMSPVQLAAVLSDKSVTEAETLSNRLLGGLGVLPGAVETDNELLARFEQNKRLIMSSTFKNLNVAESVISRAIYYNRANIKSLLGGGNRGGASLSFTRQVRRLDMGFHEVVHSVSACEV